MIKKAKSITEKEARAIAEYEELLLKRFPKLLQRIILFGSKARSDSNRASDIDLLVVVSRNGKKVRQEIAGLTHEPIVHCKVLLSPIIVDEKFFKKWSPLLEHIKRDGITIWTNKKARKSM